MSWFGWFFCCWFVLIFCFPPSVSCGKHFLAWGKYVSCLVSNQLAAHAAVLLIKLRRDLCQHSFLCQGSHLRATLAETCVDVARGVCPAALSGLSRGGESVPSPAAKCGQLVTV